MYSFEVYVGVYKGKAMYVGSGKKGRHKHLYSGTSHSYEINKFHFEGKELDIWIVYTTDDKEESLRVESFYIENLKPIWNKELKRTNYTYDKKIDYSLFGKMTEPYVRQIENLKDEIKTLEFKVKHTDKMMKTKIKEIKSQNDLINLKLAAVEYKMEKGFK